MGGRVASLVADELHAEKRIAGLVCLGYPFHPPKKPEQLRTAHLEHLACPALIVQGERDPFGGRGEVEAYRLSPAIAFHWVGDGDHDLGPPRRLGLHPQGQPRRRCGCDCGVCGDDGSALAPRRPMSEGRSAVGEPLRSPVGREQLCPQIHTLAGLHKVSFKSGLRSGLLQLTLEIQGN